MNGVRTHNVSGDVFILIPVHVKIVPNVTSYKICQILASGLWFSLCNTCFNHHGNKTDWHDLTEILLKVALNTNDLDINLIWGLLWL
jgi:hypothetical protein